MASTDTHRLYCDEAGNTGANYLDRQQPVMVFASWMVSTEAEPELLACLTNLLPKNQGAREVHAHNLLRSNRSKQGWDLTADFIDAAMVTGSVPFFYIVEKRYQLAERIVHALLDPETNPRARTCPVPGRPAYDGLVDFLYQLPESALTIFGAAVARPSAVAVRAGIEAVVTAVAISNAPLAHAISGCLANLEAVVASDFSDRVGFKHPQVTSPHLPGVVRMLEAADAYADLQYFGTVEVLHDETAQYREVLMRYFDLMTGIRAYGKGPYVAPHRPRIGFAHLRTMRFLPSHEHRGIQAADVLATSLSKLLLATCMGDSWTSPQKRVALAVFGPLLRDNLSHGGVSASRQLKEDLRSRLIEHHTH
jgi:hypothetical protein